MALRGLTPQPNASSGCLIVNDLVEKAHLRRPERFKSETRKPAAQSHARSPQRRAKLAQSLPGIIHQSTGLHQGIGRGRATNIQPRP